jgi:hypothetical protein
MRRQVRVMRSDNDGDPLFPSSATLQASNSPNFGLSRRNGKALLISAKMEQSEQDCDGRKTSYSLNPSNLNVAVYTYTPRCLHLTDLIK